MLTIAPDLLASPQRFVIHGPTGTAICSDLHLGFEAALAAAGTPMPDFTTAPLRAAWAALKGCRPARIIIAGDLFHTDTPSPATCDFARSLFDGAIPVTLVPGNHDPSLAILAKIFPEIEIAPSATVGTYAVYHGHDLPPEAKTPHHPPLILGHQHPAVTLADRVQSARMLCFATIRIRKEAPIVLLPPFSPAPLGTNLLTAHHWIMDMPMSSPGNVKIAGIVKGQVLDFGLLSGLADYSG